ncbi:hypothetical protein Zmor_026776 [Zophobas morio]|uniref:Uncharacterized protein n=1 Tax=Zophobas morio TaxID=2755281 RepID=A0AA38HUK1_9CUCU|nr:hypothetical protein Zmor_026776 [Zophobas morio]
MSSLVCLHCKIKAVKGPKCISYDRIFHPKCLERLNLEIVNSELQLVQCCDKSKSGSNQDVRGETTVLSMEYETFSIMLNKTLKSKLKPLHEEIQILRRQVEIFKESNIELTTLLSKNRLALSESNNFSPFASSLGLDVRNEENSQNEMVFKKQQVEKLGDRTDKRITADYSKAKMRWNRAIQVMPMMVSGKLKKSDNVRREYV